MYCNSCVIVEFSSCVHRGSQERDAAHLRGDFGLTLLNGVETVKNKGLLGV